MEYFLNVFEYHHLFILLLGLLLGILVGALPGLTPTMGVALMIPFTFSLGATEGLIMLGGIYCGSVFGGSIPAILFNVPGAPANVATTFDGYPMTKNGEARKALEITTISSVFGGLVGMVMLLYFAPIFADFSLKFGPTESFWIALFGLTVIAAISDGSITKNLVGGCFGILISCIGIHTVTGTPRFTFGMDDLIGGLHVVAVLIGLFAFPQALRLMEQLTSIDTSKPLIYKIRKSSIKQSFKDVFRKPKSVGIGSGMGAFIGLIPGAGGNIASILAYNEVKRFSKQKGTFGKGEKNGVIASESANNAMVGGSLIPLLTLGIPGSPTAAIFLGGLLIHGIWPGRNLFVQHADVAYTFIYSMVVAQIVLLFLGLFLIKYMTRLTQIPSYIMAPVILSFSIIGAYTMQNNLFDIYTVVIIGLIMFIFQKFEFAAAPIALGFILGPIAEVGLLQGLQVGAARGSAFTYFFTGSLNMILYGLVMLTIFVSFFQQYRKWKQTQKEMTNQKVKLRFTNLFSRNVLSWGLVALSSIGLMFMLEQLVFEQRILPQITFAALLIISIVEWIKAIHQGEKLKTQPLMIKNLPLLLFVSMISVLTLLLGYYIQVVILMISVPLYLVYVRKNEDIKVKKVLVISLSFTIALYIIFSILLKVPLPLPLNM